MTEDSYLVFIDKHPCQALVATLQRLLLRMKYRIFDWGKKKVKKIPIIEYEIWNGPDGIKPNRIRGRRVYLRHGKQGFKLSSLLDAVRPFLKDAGINRN